MKEDTNTDYFKLCMEAVVNSDIGANSIGGDAFADEQLLIASKTSMSSKLRKGRKNGRHGWWTPKVCSIEELYVNCVKRLLPKTITSALLITRP